jgi:hypothetical protein
MSKREDDLERELRDHLELEAEEQRGAGASAEESRLAARRVFGNLAHTKENVRAAWGWTLLEQFAADVRYGVRTMRRSPGLTAVAVLSLALGIGANTAIFSVADAALFRTLPVAKPEQLDLLTIEAHGSTFTLMDSEEYRALQQPMRPISAMIARFAMSFSVAAGAEASRVVVEFVSGNYFTALGVGPLAGRVLTDDDDPHALGQSRRGDRLPLLAPETGGRPGGDRQDDSHQRQPVHNCRDCAAGVLWRRSRLGAGGLDSRQHDGPILPGGRNASECDVAARAGGVA